MTARATCQIAATAPMISRDRLLVALAGQALDRPPVICPGGMMTMGTASAMRSAGAFWPAAHSDARAMAGLVLATREETGLECLSVPFCMTVEAQALGCQVDMGTETVLPHVARHAIDDVSQIELPPRFDLARRGRVPVVLEALRILKRRAGPDPVIGAVVGPVSLAAMVMQDGIFLRLLRRDAHAALRLIAALEKSIRRFALAQRAAGADCTTIAEPTATGEVLGASHFAHFALPALARLLRGLRQRGVPVILHICGDVRPIVAPLRQLDRAIGGHLALSVDAMVSGHRLQAELPGVVRVGNVDALLLERGPGSAVEAAARRAARGFQVVAPACGLVPTTPAANLRALVRVVQGEQAAH